MILENNYNVVDDYK